MSKKNEENTKFILPAAKGQSIMIIVKHTHVTFNYLNKATIIIKKAAKKRTRKKLARTGSRNIIYVESERVNGFAANQEKRFIIQSKMERNSENMHQTGNNALRIKLTRSCLS